MAIHDYIIDNQTAPNFRADLNQALQAIVSNNSNPSAPTVTYANMIWYDTTNKLLRMRTEADDAWITLGTLDQVSNTFAPAGLLNLSRGQVQNAASTVFGQVSGQRLDQQTNAAFNVSGAAPKFACRAWVNFKGTGTVGINGSGNVSSVTDNGLGDYTVNFATGMPDGNYSLAISGLSPGLSTGAAQAVYGEINRSPSGVRILSQRADTGAGVDRDPIHVQAFR